ncbi:hypothetical protein [Singulisphaera sp. PoT]|uniref:hypothetical protein n=1 Tax=Singulisphaera sp. PoT TaxID=3411797 RepID=UPI003BF58194
MMRNVKWYGEAAKSAIKAHVRQNIRAACIALVNRVKEKLSVPGTGLAPKSRKATAKRKAVRKGQRRYNVAPSAPGEPPRKQKGRLRGSIAWELVDLAGRVGTNLIYGRALEKGNRKGNLKPRPFLLKTLYEMKSTIRRILSRPMP